MLALISAEGGHYDAAVANARAALQASGGHQSAETVAVLALLALLMSARRVPVKSGLHCIDYVLCLRAGLSVGYKSYLSMCMSASEQMVRHK